MLREWLNGVRHRMKKDHLENFSASQGGDNGDFNLGSISEVEVKGRD